MIIPAIILAMIAGLATILTTATLVEETETPIIGRGGTLGVPAQQDIMIMEVIRALNATTNALPATLMPITVILVMVHTDIIPHHVLAPAIIMTTEHQTANLATILATLARPLQAVIPAIAAITDIKYQDTLIVHVQLDIMILVPPGASLVILLA
jgi:hypothetical protein